MDKRPIKIAIDNEADILLIAKQDPYIGQICEELRDEIIVRKNPLTNEIELIQIMNFSERFAKNDVFELPIMARFFAT